MRKNRQAVQCGSRPKGSARQQRDTTQCTLADALGALLTFKLSTEPEDTRSSRSSACRPVIQFMLYSGLPRTRVLSWQHSGSQRPKQRSTSKA